MSLHAINGKGPNDQKILNEELVGGIVDVARRNPQHAAELFGVPLGVALRMVTLTESQLDDLATTPVALWRPRIDAARVHRLSERRPMASPEFEAYRPVLERLNRLALATFVRYADDPVEAALVCDLSDRDTIVALQELPAFASMEWGGNPGVPLVSPVLGEPAIDRLVRTEGEAVDPPLRGLLAFAHRSEPEFEGLHEQLQAEVAEAASSDPPASVPKRSGRPVSNFLMPDTSALIVMMLRHQMRPSEVEEHMLPTSDVRAVQLRGIAETLNPRPKRAKGAPRDRSRDHRDLWGSAHRRLTATAIWLLHRRLVAAGIDAFEALIRAYDYYTGTYDPACGVSLSRMIKDVFAPMRTGLDTRLSHCLKCSVVHVSHDEKAGIIECPVCVLARAGRFGARRLRPQRPETAEATLPRTPGAWTGGPLWFSPLPAAVQANGLR
jgi:hypothetical protein